MRLTSTPLILLGPSLASAHFLLNWPTARGFNDDKAAEYPCGGFETPSTNRTMIPVNAPFPIQLDMHHTEANVQVLIGLGNDVGPAFNYVLRPLLRERGPNDFCLGGVVVPGMLGGMNISEGTNATIQVVTNGDPDGGLYQCADVTFTAAPLSESDYNAHCSNSTGVSAEFTNTNANANQSESGTTATSTGTAPNATASGTSAAVAAFEPLSAWGLLVGLGAAVVAGL
ncbi:putative GPI anchored protein [Phyllosticta citribraziliensis]|uniref:GPI anchored protein n=1 Tax=Phyllosticta citribraziliensis TaxID=989973 RepID=A0ABR1LME4_9PEZI